MERPRGRPPFVVTKQVLTEVRRLSGLGLYDYDIAATMGISAGYLPMLKTKHPALAAAFQQGRSDGLAFVTGKLMEAVERNSLPAIIFYLRCKGGWSEHSQEPRNQEPVTGEKSVSERILAYIETSSTIVRSTTASPNLCQ